MKEYGEEKRVMKGREYIGGERERGERRGRETRGGEGRVALDVSRVWIDVGRSIDD